MTQLAVLFVFGTLRYLKEKKEICLSPYEVHLLAKQMFHMVVLLKLVLFTFVDILLKYLLLQANMHKVSFYNNM